MGQEIQPLRLALRYVPAALIVEYTIGSNKSLYHHEIDFNHLTSTKQSHEELLEEIIDKHQEVIGKISKRQLQRLLQHLVEHQKKTNVNLLPQVQQLPQADYNRVSEVQLKQVKNRMDVVFQQNLLKPGDEEYVYDKQVDFQAPQKKSEWDDED